jgi:II/X family phage/plasmid replication protein
MIDWLTFRLPLAMPLDVGVVMSVDADGSIEWCAPKALSVEGSHSSSVRLRRFSYDTTLEISGNPAKFLQGHNLFGSDDLPGLCRAFARSICARVDYQPSDAEQAIIDADLARLTRVDLTQSWDFGTLPRALSVIRALDGLVFAHRGRGSLTGEGTVYWRKQSRRLASKAYSKGNEIKAKGHTLPVALEFRDELIEHAAGHVRFEHTLRGMWLKARGLDVVQNWATLGVTPQGLHAELMSQLTLTDAAAPDELVEQLPARLRLIYRAWQSGDDLRRTLPIRSFYRYRKQLLEHGIDIASTQHQREPSNVIPLRIVLTGTPATVPAWAKGTPLYFEPAAAAAA